MPPVTQQQIANRAGVDRSLVSLALRNSPKVAKSTRLRIQHLAHELGYRPNAALAEAARVRFRGRTRAREAVAYLRTLHQSPKRSWLQTDALDRRLEELGYQMSIYDPQDYPGDAALSRTLFQRGIRAVVMEQVGLHDTEHELDWQKFCVVRCGLLRATRYRVDEVRLDFMGVVNAAVARLAALGCRRIACVIDGEKEFASDQLLLQSAQGAWRRPGGDTAVASVIWWDHARGDAASVGTQVAKAKPDGIILSTHPYLDLLRQVRPEMHQLPAVVLIGDNLPESYPGAFSFVPQMPLIAALAAEHLAGLIANHQYGLPSRQLSLTIVPPWRDG